ncbi:MAG: hypothetical protein BECKG1743F_GA0114225_103161, partial [Candidatus Kentron sp. G]
GVMKNFITNSQCLIISCLQKLSFGCPVLPLPNDIEQIVKFYVANYVRKGSGKLFPSTGCQSPRRVSNNSHYRKSSGVDRIRLI